jgi:hypothetical protein
MDNQLKEETRKMVFTALFFGFQSTDQMRSDFGSDLIDPFIVEFKDHILWMKNNLILSKWDGNLSKIEIMHWLNEKGEKVDMFGDRLSS